MKLHATDMAARARLLTFLSLAAISFSAPLGKLAMETGASAIAVGLYRMIFSTLLMLPLSLQNAENRKAFALFQGRALWTSFLSGALLAGHFITWYLALGNTSVFNTTVLVSLQPFFTLMGAWLIFREQPLRRPLIGMLLAFFGTIIMGLGNREGEGNLTGNVMALLSGLFYAAYLLSGRAARTTLPAYPYATVVYAVCSAVLLLAMLLSRSSFYVSGYVVLLCLGLAVLASLLGHTIWNWALGYISATFISLVGLGEPVGASLVTFLMTGAYPSQWALAGGALILLGVVLYTVLLIRIQRTSGTL